MQVNFDCEDCGAHGKVVFKEDISFKQSECTYCPFCSADISQPINVDDEYDE